MGSREGTAAARLVGRDDELRRLDALVDGIGTGPRFVVLAGDAGIGKTSLLAHLAARSEAAGHLVLDGRATELERDAPFGVVVDALDHYVTANRTFLASGLRDDELQELGSVLPGLRAENDGTVPAAGPESRVQAYRAAGRLLELLAGRSPVVLVLDDLHWADRSALELIGHLLRHPPAVPVVVAGAYRPGQVDGSFAGEVASAVSAGDAVVITLGPLDREAAEQLMAEATVDRAQLYQRSGGNPFYLQHLLDAADLDGGPAPTGDIPATVRLTTERELAHVSPAGRALIAAAAVVGDPFDLDLVQRVGSIDEAEALDALDELAAHDLVRSTEIPRQFAFRHPLVRAAVYESASPGNRLRMHQRCADELARRGAPPVARAHHVEFSARHGDDEAIALLADAATAVADRAPASAARWLQQAMRLLPEGADDGRRLGLVAPLAALLAAVGDLDGACDAMREAVDLVPATDVELRAQLTAACAGLEQAAGHHVEADRRLAAAVDELERDEGPAAVALLIAVTVTRGYLRDYEDMQRWSARAIAAARTVDDVALRAATEAVHAFGQVVVGRTADARLACDATAELIDAMDDATLLGRLDAVANLAASELYLNRFEAAGRHAARGIALGRATGTLNQAPTLVSSLGTAVSTLGRPAEAVAIFEDGVERARVARERQGLAWALFNLCLAEVAVGDLDAARDAGEESIGLARAIDESILLAWVVEAAGLARCESGDAAGALHLVDEFIGPHADGFPGAIRAALFDMICRCHLQLGHLGRAGDAAATALAIGEAMDLPLARTWGHRATALVALARGDADDAVRGAEVAADHAASVGAVLEVARSRWVAGQALVAAGDRQAAVEALRAAAETYDRTGALPWRDRVEQDLGGLGQRPHRRSSPAEADRGVAALTGRELEIARLVVDRRTNAEIAAALFLSQKTVETHLRNIFRKLDVSSRAEVARVVEAAERA